VSDGQAAMRPANARPSTLIYRAAPAQNPPGKLPRDLPGQKPVKQVDKSASFSFLYKEFG
jgi:hypothetical protein